MNVFDVLADYKNQVLSLTKNSKNKQFLNDSFTRWFLNADKDEFIPKQDIVLQADLEYANKHKRCSFPVNFKKQTEKIFKSLMTDILTEEYSNKDFLLNKNQLIRLKNLYTGTGDSFENDKNKLINLYDFIGMNSIHLSVPYIYDFEAELFGSPLNTRFAYCSAFEFEKEKFSSLGNFFDFTFPESKENTVYVSNPPFDESIIKQMSLHFNKIFKLATHAIVVITIPVWDSYSQKKYKLKDYGLKFEGYEILLKSKFFKKSTFLDKFKYQYYDYYNEKMVPVSHTHLVILASSDITYSYVDDLHNLLLKNWSEKRSPIEYREAILN